MMRDVVRYASEGITTSSIRAHINAMGPTSLLWPAAAVRFLPGYDQLRIARLAGVASWVLLGIVVFTLAPKSVFPGVWYAVLLFTLIFPHTMTAMATVLTEGPAILFAIAGSMLWLKGANRAKTSLSPAICILAGGCLFGLAVTSRQYYLAAVGAAMLLSLEIFFKRRSEKSSTTLWLSMVGISFVLALVPLAFLYRIWGGLSSPAMSQGLSYGVTSHIGLNVLRPIIATLCVAIYLLLFTFPEEFRGGSSSRKLDIALAIIVGVIAAQALPRVLEPGPIHSFVAVAERLHGGGAIVFGLLSGFAIFNGAAFVRRVWSRRTELRNCPPVLFAALVLCLFIVEQIAIGGGVPFYDRYVLQIAPFLGAVIFFRAPRLAPPRYLALAFSWLVSQFMLWRYLWTAASS